MEDVFQDGNAYTILSLLRLLLRSQSGSAARWLTCMGKVKSVILHRRWMTFFDNRQSTARSSVRRSKSHYSVRLSAAIVVENYVSLFFTGLRGVVFKLLSGATQLDRKFTHTELNLSVHLYCRLKMSRYRQLCRCLSGGLTMRQWRHEPPAPNFWAKKSAPHSDPFQILDIVT